MLFDNPLFISIHEATQASTDERLLNLVSMAISIHEATQASTQDTLGVVKGSNDFNPRSHTGFDKYKQIILYMFWNFNPRSHTGFDVLSWILDRL